MNEAKIFPMWFNLQGRQLGVKYENDALAYLVDDQIVTRDAFDAVLLEWARSEAKPKAGEK